MVFIFTHNRIKQNGWENDMKIFALVHDSILAEVKEEKIEKYSKIVLEEVQKDTACWLGWHCKANRLQRRCPN